MRDDDAIPDVVGTFREWTVSNDWPGVKRATALIRVSGERLAGLPEPGTLVRAVAVHGHRVVTFVGMVHAVEPMRRLVQVQSCGEVQSVDALAWQMRRRIREIRGDDAR